MILLIAGTRPELIKLHPIYHALKVTKRFGPFAVPIRLLLVQQQKDLIQQHVHGFSSDEVIPLELGEATDARAAQGLDTLYPALLGALDQWFGIRTGGSGDIAVVQGDTLTAVAGATVAKAHGWTVVHVEAGLRSPRADSPYPEEWARRAIARLANVHCAPTALAERNLRTEGVPGLILRTGNTGVDALVHTLRELGPPDMTTTPIRVLVTCHRREAWATALPALVAAVADVAQTHSDWIVTWPLHPNSLIRKLTEPLSAFPNVHRPAALGRKAFVAEMLRAHAIVTDSGGVIEDAVTMGRSVAIIRDETERPEALIGVNQLVPAASMSRLAATVFGLAMWETPAPSTVFGDGHAADRIAHLLLGMLPCPS